MVKIADGIELNVRIAGQGSPLVFIHGYPLHSGMWEPQVEALSADFRVIAIDLRGHGESQVVPGPYSMDLLADDCASLLDSLEVSEPVTLCGLSMGGYVAFAFFRRHRSRLNALILAATRPGADSPEGKQAREQAADTVASKGIEALIDGILPKMLAPSAYESRPDLVAQVRRIMRENSPESYVGDLLGMRDRPDSAGTLADIDIPALVLHGEDDQIIPPSEAEGMQSAIRASRLAVLPNSGHLLNLEQPGQFNTAVKDFVRTR